jgi:hypothetical protein
MFGKESLEAKLIPINASKTPKKSVFSCFSPSATFNTERFDNVELDDDGTDDEANEQQGEPNELQVIVVGARNLIASDTHAFTREKSSDPYVAVCFGSREKRTPVLNSTLNPRWRAPQKFVFPLGKAKDKKELSADVKAHRKKKRKNDTKAEDLSTLAFHVRDRDMLTIDDQLGSAHLSLSDLKDKLRHARVHQGMWIGMWLKLSGDVSGTSYLTKVPATGELYVRCRLVHNPERASHLTCNKPLGPKALRFVLIALLALVWLASFVCSLFTQLLSALLEALAAAIVVVVVRIVSGFRVDLNRLSIRFGDFWSNKGAPTEIVVSGLTIYNPNGGYRSPYLARIERMDVHLKLHTILPSMAWCKWRYPGHDKVKASKRITIKKKDGSLVPLEGKAAPKKQPKAPPPMAAATVDLIRIDGITVYTEKNTSPFVEQPEMLLNTKAFREPTPVVEVDAEKEGHRNLSKSEKEAAEEPSERKGDLPREAMKVPLLFHFRTIQITDLNLYPADLISDILGDPDGVGDILEQKPVEIDKVVCVYDDFHETSKVPQCGDKEMLWLGEVIGVLTHMVQKNLPISAIIRSSLAPAVGSVWCDNMTAAADRFKTRVGVLGTHIK